MSSYVVTLKRIIYERAFLEATDKEEALKLAESNQLEFEDSRFGDSEIIGIELLDDGGSTEEACFVEDGKFKD